MRYLGPIFFIILLAGCASNKQAEAPKAKPKVVAAKVVETPKTKILPLNARVVKVQENFRFVIIDFTNGRRPNLDERLSVYRVGEKVAEVKISGPYFQGTTVAADIVAGEAKYGDEVKAD